MDKYLALRNGVWRVPITRRVPTEELKLNMC